jgi:hypothetical protein
MYQKVEEEKDLLRDDFSKAIVSANISAYNLAKEKAKKVLEEKARIENLENRINLMEGLLQQILEKLHG